MWRSHGLVLAEIEVPAVADVQLGGNRQLQHAAGGVRHLLFVADAEQELAASMIERRVERKRGGFVFLDAQALLQEVRGAEQHQHRTGIHA